jgi:hypothetical protein
MPNILVASGTGFFGRLANVRLLGASREVRRVEERPTGVPEEPAILDVREIQRNGEASIIAEDLDHHAERLDAVAGSEFVDDRIRLRE